MELKRGIDSVCMELKAENPGSRWPKTSLAALRDRARLTPKQLETLNAICACGCLHLFAVRGRLYRVPTLWPPVTYAQQPSGS